MSEGVGMIPWIIAAISAFFVKGLCGFANTLVFTSILSFGVNNASISPVELLLGYPGNLILAWKERKQINWKICGPLAALVMIGSIPGAFFLKNANTTVIKLIFGVVIILIGAEMLFREFYPRKMRKSKVFTVLVGVLSGILCGLYGVGALLGAYLSRVTDDSHAFKGNISVVFFIENTFRIVLYSCWGIITLEAAKQAVILLPFMLGGLGLGIFAGQRIPERFVKRLVIVLLMISGVVLVWQSI